MLKLDNIKIEYEHIVLEKSKLEIPENCITLIRGTSGSGKTSILYRLGLISEDQKYTFIYQDKDLTQQGERERSCFRQNHIAYLLQDNSLFEQYDVLGNLKLYAGFSQKEYSESEYQQFIDSVHLKVPFEQPVSTLSGGEKQRLAIACCLCKDTDILIFDEPTSFLDAENENNVFQVLREITDTYHKTVILASHSQKAIEIADQVYEIRNHRVYEVKHHEEEFEEKKNRKSCNGLSVAFCLSYVQYFFHKYLIYESMIIFCSVLLITLMNLLIMHTDTVTAEAIHAFKSLSENQMFITANDESTTVDTATIPFDLRINSEHAAIYPYAPVFAEIANMPYQVIPYFEQNEIKSHVNTFYSDTGIYLSSATVQMINSMHLNPKNEGINLKMILKDGTVIKDNQSLQIGGTLENRFQTNYFENPNTPYILCDYRILNDLYKKSPLQEYTGYTLFTDTFEAYTELYGILKEQGYGVNLFFEHLDEMNELIKINQINKTILIFVGDLIAFILCTIMEIYYFQKRKKEILLLKINGAQKADMMKILIGDLLLHILCILAVNMLQLLILKGQQYLIQNVIFIVLLFVMESTVIIFMINRFSAERILRN